MEAKMATVTFSGTGILAGTHDFDEIDRRFEEDRRKASAAAELAAEQALKEQEIEWALSQTLGTELAAEIESQKLDAKTLKRYREDFAQFRKYAEDSGLPYLPASPQVTALFLGEHGVKSLAHFHRLRNAIACAHRMAGFPDPTADLLVLAVGRLLRDNKSKSPTPATPAQH
jgi:hypothetical protein